MDHLRTPHRFLRHLLTIPFLFSAVIPIVILDLWIEVYHRISFPFYRLPYVKRGHYIKIDRHRLSYLNPMQKLNCLYCGYANGVLQFWVKIVGDTEKYWCAIKHKPDEKYNAPEHHNEFIGYNDEDEFITVYESKKTRPF